MTNTTDTSPEAVERLNALHRQLCFENGDHPQEIDTPYSLGADALVRVRALSAALKYERKENAELKQECAAAWGKCGERRIAQEAAEAERDALKAELAEAVRFFEAIADGRFRTPSENVRRARAFLARHQKGTKP